MMRSHRAYQETDPLIPRIPRLRKPAIIFWGEKDRIVPLSDGERLARETGGRLFVIKEAGHGPYFRAAGEIGKDVNNLLQQPGGS